MTAKQKNAMNALACISGYLDCSILTISKPPMMNMNAVSGDIYIPYVIYYSMFNITLTKLEITATWTDMIKTTHKAFQD